jgi:hypothetical protein
VLIGCMHGDARWNRDAVSFVGTKSCTSAAEFEFFVQLFVCMPCANYFEVNALQHMIRDSTTTIYITDS